MIDGDTIERFVSALERLVKAVEYRNEVEYPRAFIEQLWKKQADERDQKIQDILDLAIRLKMKEKIPLGVLNMPGPATP